MLDGEKEEGTMEKAGRPSSVPPRGNGSDTRKDGYGSSKKKRGSRGKESAGGRPHADAVPRRSTPQQQKFRPVDKRPRARGSYNVHEKQEVTLGQEAEQGSVWKPGSKKQNLNHLLNFSYDSHDHFSGGRGGRRPTANWSAKKAVKFNKEQFLQANCQFVVRDDGDYAIHSADPDTLVEWSNVEQLRLFSEGVPSCPICLFPPVAAKITRCGHVYCWPCMLHYLSLSEKSWAKCPICFEAVHEKDLKSVEALHTPSVKMGTPITLTLMKRERGSTICMPSYQWKSIDKPLNVDGDEDFCFAKLLCATPQQVLDILDKEKAALLKQLQEDGNESLEGSYINAALEVLKKRKQDVDTRIEAKEEVADLMNALDMNEDGKEESAVNVSVNKAKMTYSSAFSDEEEEICGGEELEEGKSDESGALHRPSSSSNEDSEVAEETSDSKPEVVSDYAEDEEVVTVEEAAEDLALPQPETPQTTKTNSAYYFYQASDGQHIYLHSINARCLVKEYGSLENCPPTIQANIVETEGITMSEELRRRLRYLNHLPLTCEFQVVELALKPPLVSKHVLAGFADEIDRRRHLRHKKSRDERRKLKKMQEEENRKMELCPEWRASLGGIQNGSFPEMRSVIVPSEAPILQAGGSGSTGSSPMVTPIGSPPAAEDDGGQTTGLSFAQMLRAGKAQAQPAWGNKTALAAADSSKIRNPDSDSDSEDRVPVPTFQQSFGDAIQAALDSAGKDTVGAEAGTKSGKKKKKVKKLLFTTTMPRAK